MGAIKGDTRSLDNGSYRDNGDNGKENGNNYILGNICITWGLGD